MDWEQLLTPKRLGKVEPEPPEYARTCFQRDYDRLAFSSAFRRLKDKTQVFSLAKHDYVRTRLIHSIEVSCVGRSLGTIVGEEVVQRHKLSSDLRPSSFSDIVFAACIAHDIGNPPFGHSGEDAIRAAFQRWDKQQEEVESLSLEQKSDLDKFEGNAQGFRILTRLGMQPQRGGMQLTCPTLAAFMKYPRAAHIPEKTLLPFAGKSTRKYGFFQAEKELFAEVAGVVGLIRRDSQYAWWVRHPLTFLVEAADDICYSIVDLEDGHRMGLIPFIEAEELLNAIAGISSENRNYSKSERIKHLRASAINKLVLEAAETFLEEEDKILSGSFDQALLSKSRYTDILKKIEDVTQRKIFDNPEVVSVQAAGYEVLGSLFENFIDAALTSSKRGILFLKLLPEEYRPSAEDGCYEKILKITDYLSGMTDSYAASLFQDLRGISLS